MSKFQSSRPWRWPVSALLAVPAFVCLYAYAAHRWGVPRWVAGLYAGMSAVALLVFAWDKFAAVRGAWRTPERTLLLLSLACGWPGALLGQHLLRHKTSKASFRAAFWAVVALNAVLFVAVVSRVGRG